MTIVMGAFQTQAQVPGPAQTDLSWEDCEERHLWPDHKFHELPTNAVPPMFTALQGLSGRVKKQLANLWPMSQVIAC